MEMGKSLRELLEEDEKDPMNDNDLDEAIWLDLCKRISNPEDLKHFQPPVAVFYASYLMEHEVGNGGFSQAALNIPEWFELSAEAYRTLGKSVAASIITEVYQRLPENEEIAKKFARVRFSGRIILLTIASIFMTSVPTRRKSGR